MNWRVIVELVGCNGTGGGNTAECPAATGAVINTCFSRFTSINSIPAFVMVAGREGTNATPVRQADLALPASARPQTRAVKRVRGIQETLFGLAPTRPAPPAAETKPQSPRHRRTCAASPWTSARSVGPIRKPAAA
jgi:hypothetical protein